MNTWLDAQDQSKIDAVMEKFRTSSAYETYLDYANDDERFALWLRMADLKMFRNVGVTHRDIGDWNWPDAYLGGTAPGEAALAALRADDTYSLLFVVV